jgi:hypothetical protein
VTRSERLISVDVETSGPAPSVYSLLSIGACVVGDVDTQFYVELKPVHMRQTPEAFATHGLSLDDLRDSGVPAEEAMAAFEAWVLDAVSDGATPVFVGFNAPFDWMFVADYFHQFLGRNPFGHAALDIKAWFMGAAGVPFGATSRSKIDARYPDLPSLEHHALQDAIDQAHLFSRMLADPDLRGDHHG